VKLVRGRHISERDNETSESVAVVNEAFVRRFFKSHEDPLDQHFGLDLPENVNSYRIVGIVRDAKFAGFALDQPARPMFYVPLAQTVKYENPLMQRIEFQSHFVRGLLLVTSLPPSTLEPELRKTLAAADPNLTITSVRTLQQQLDRSFDQQRAVTSLAGLFGIVALVLAAIGLYGVTAYTVAQRTNEIGIRMALGADRGAVVGMVVREGMWLIAAGLAIGTVAVLAAGRFVASLLFDLAPADPWTLAGAAGLLVALAAIAGYLPARTASRVDPMVALRTE
jgi:predicted permease